ncbi:hypothetical protein CSB08_01025 [Candidatus Gracilibacteria bacterium]|nr:MAG: hypothetical protein CSB08_01025 [Candidatus Gracilibacteria bacterium]
MISRLFKYALKNILRNKFLSLSSILVLTLLMFFINILFLLNSVSGKIIELISDKLTISLYLNEEYDNKSIDVLDLMSDIRKTFKNISVVYKTKAEVLESVRKKDPDLVKIIERTNPLPNTIKISSISLDQYEALNMLIENKLYILLNKKSDKEYFSNYSVQYKRIKYIIKILDHIQVGLYSIILFFVISISIIIYSIIGNFIFYFKDEIYITRLVGGGKNFIYGPFVMQGMIYSFLSFFLNFFVFWFMLKNSKILFGEEYGIPFLFSNADEIFLIEFLVFLFIGGFSGFLSSRKYIK